MGGFVKARKRRFGQHCRLRFRSVCLAKPAGGPISPHRLGVAASGDRLTYRLGDGTVRYMSQHQTKDVERLASMFKALSNPNRLQIFLRLISCCQPGKRRTGNKDEAMCACVGELGSDLRISPSTVSHHIKELHQAGLIQMERRGQNVDCWVAPEVLETLPDFFHTGNSR